MEINSDKASILKRIAHAKAVSKEWHERIRESRRLYNFDHYNVRARAGESRYADPTYTNTVDLGVGIIGANKMDWHAYGWQSSLVEQDETSKIEKFLTGLVDASSLREEYDIPMELITNLVRDGAAVIYSVWDTQIAREYVDMIEIPTADDEGVETAKAYLEPPFRVKSIDPLNIFLVPGGPKRWLAVASISKETVQDIEVRFDVPISRYSHLTPDQKSSRKDEFIDYWELIEVSSGGSEEEFDDNGELQPVAKQYAVRNALIFGGQFIRDPRIMPGYSDLPYTIGFFKPVDRMKPEDWGHGILEPMRTSVDLLEKTINRRARQIDVFSSLPMFSRTASGRTIQMDPGLGPIVPLRPDEALEFPRWQGNSPDVEEQIGYLRAKVQQSSFSDLAYGAGTNQVSGYALSQVSDQNRIRLEQPVRNLKLMWESWANKVLKMAANFASDAYIRVYGRLRGASFAEQVFGDGVDQYKVECLIKPQFPNEITRNHGFANQMRGLLSERTIGERYLGIEQMEDELDRKTAEQLRQNPIIQQYIVITQIMELAEEGDKAAGLLLQQMQQGNIPGQPGRPEDPTVGMTQPTGLQSATGTPPAQVAGAPPGGGVEGMLNSAVEVPLG